MQPPIKPLKGKAYGSIPHLPGSRMGPADHHCHPGQERICCEKARDKHDRIIVTEKLDGACVSVANVGGDIVALIRAGYPAVSARFEHLRLFDVWAWQNRDKFAFLQPGMRVCGEWLAQAHGTVYKLTGDPFIAFDIIADGERLPYHEAEAALRANGIEPAALLYAGGPFPTADAMAALSDCGFHGAQECPEGAVWRVERRGKFNFIAKYVRPDKQDGKYLPELSGGEPIWHWRPQREAAE